MTPLLDLSPDQLLTTTRAVRRRLDYDRPVPSALVEECVQIALQAPSGSNARGWHFVVIGDERKRAQIGELYRKAFDLYRDMPISAHALASRARGDDAPVMKQVVDSAEALAQNLHRAPFLVIPCISGRIPPIEGPQANMIQSSIYGSILPAFWSFMLAARARGLGTAWTTLHLMFEQPIAEILDIPYDEFMQVAMTPLAYTVGTDFKPARNRSLAGTLHVDRW